MPRLIRLILLLVVAFASDARATSNYFTHLWQTEDGLPQNAVTSIIQTGDGYLWLGTYQGLVGLSISRGFTHKVRELFGGPRGCTHTTALLQAMAPVAIQSIWSFRMAQTEGGAPSGPFDTAAAREGVLATNLNSCHVWAEDSEHVATLRNGEPMEVPLWITKRFSELGRDASSWRSDR